MLHLTGVVCVPSWCTLALRALPLSFALRSRVDSWLTRPYFYSSPQSPPSIIIDFKHVTLTIDGKRVKVQIWDTAGQERFRNITQTYYRKAQGTLLVYDITNRATFESVDNWMKTIQQQAGDQVNKILVGNKMDCEPQRMVQSHEGQKLADRYGIKFFETSAKTEQNVAGSLVVSLNPPLRLFHH